MYISLLSSVRFKGEIFVICNKKKKKKTRKNFKPVGRKFLTGYKFTGNVLERNF